MRRLPGSRWRGAVLGMAVLLAAASAQAAGPRVASATICADQFVLKLADPGQIAALSARADEPWLSLLAAEAAAHPRVQPSAETYLDLGVDVVVTDAWSGRFTAALLERFGVKVVRLSTVNTFAEIDRMTRTVAEALGQAERGAALVREMRRRLDRVRRNAAGDGRLGLYLRPGGGSAAEGTFVDAVLTANALRNHASLQGATGWTSYDLEHFILSPPEVLVTSFFDRPHPSLRRAFARHPAFRRRAANLPHIEVPGATWICSGWFLPLAAAHLADGLNAISLPEQP